MAKITLDKKEIDAILFMIDFLKEESGDLLDIQKKLKRKFERAKQPMKTSSRKGKGRGLQKYVCSKLAELLGIEYNQSDDTCLIRSRGMGQAGTDIILRGMAREKIKFDIECKNSESLSLYKAIEQSKLNTQDGRIWMVIHKKNQSKPIAILDFEDFLKIMKKSL